MDRKQNKDVSDDNILIQLMLFYYFSMINVENGNLMNVICFSLKLSNMNFQETLNYKLQNTDSINVF